MSYIALTLALAALVAWVRGIMWVRRRFHAWLNREDHVLEDLEEEARQTRAMLDGHDAETWETLADRPPTRLE